MTIYPLGALPEELCSRAGGKAKGLDLLVRNQFNVPRGFVDRSHLLESVHRCLASLEADRVKDYARHFELDKARMNLVV